MPPTSSWPRHNLRRRGSCPTICRQMSTPAPLESSQEAKQRGAPRGRSMTQAVDPGWAVHRFCRCADNAPVLHIGPYGHPGLRRRDRGLGRPVDGRRAFHAERLGVVARLFLGDRRSAQYHRRMDTRSQFNAAPPGPSVRRVVGRLLAARVETEPSQMVARSRIPGSWSPGRPADGRPGRGAGAIRSDRDYGSDSKLARWDAYGGRCSRQFRPCRRCARV